MVAGLARNAASDARARIFSYYLYQLLWLAIQDLELESAADLEYPFLGHRNIWSGRIIHPERTDPSREEKIPNTRLG